MDKPTLVVMAAGMGARYGGLKQTEPISEQGEIIIDFSLYDALMAGFEKAVFIIKREIEADIRARIDDGAGRHMDAVYVYQELTDLPPGYTLPEGRVKPWGTCHAVLAARGVLGGNIAVINADDYYGAQAFRLMYDYLLTARDGACYDYSMIGYRLANTLTEHGHVSRGVCSVDGLGRLTGVDERLKIMWRPGSAPETAPETASGCSASDSAQEGPAPGSAPESAKEGSASGASQGGPAQNAAPAPGARTIAYEDEAGLWHDVPPDATVSMNFWGFTPSFLEELERGFPPFLDEALKTNPEKAEYLLPRKVDELLKSGRATVKVIPTDERWFGVTYKEDKEHVAAAVRAMKDRGLYPERLW